MTLLPHQCVPACQVCPGLPGLPVCPGLPGLPGLPNRLCRKVDQLSDEDQKALMIVLDSLVERSKGSRVMAELSR